MQTIAVTLTLQEAQLVLDALVELPFKKVADLIHKIQKQAADQLAAAQSIDQLVVEEPKESPHDQE